MKKRIRVVAAILERDDGRFLITQRNPQAFMPLMWEFPGGKVEPGETDPLALARELREELGVEVDVGEAFIGSLHEYSEFEVDFHVYRCRLLKGEIQSIGVNDFRWVTTEELAQFDFPPADQTTIRRLIEKE